MLKAQAKCVYFSGDPIPAKAKEQPAWLCGRWKQWRQYSHCIKCFVTTCEAENMIRQRDGVRRRNKKLLKVLPAYRWVKYVRCKKQKKHLRNGSSEKKKKRQLLPQPWELPTDIIRLKNKPHGQLGQQTHFGMWSSLSRRGAAQS